MSENWQAGDLALCVHLGPWFSALSGNIHPRQNCHPKAGDISRVDGLRIGRDGRERLLLERFAEKNIRGIRYSYTPQCFRKVTPPEADEFDREVIELMTKQPEQV